MKSKEKLNSYKFEFDFWHMDLTLQAENLDDAKKKFKGYYKKEFNGKIIQL